MRSLRRMLLSDEDVVLAAGELGRQTLIWDQAVPNLCLRLHPTGSKSFLVRYSFENRTRWYTIGAPGRPWTVHEARELAKTVLAAAKEGRDLGAEKQAERHTVSRLIDRYLRDGPLSKLEKRASSWAADRSNLDRHVRPLLGGRKVSTLTRMDLTRMAKSIMDGETAGSFKTRARGTARVRGGLGAARRTMQVTAAMFRWAMEEGMMHSNPALGVRLPRSEAQERFLTKSEATKLLATIAEMEARKELSSVYGDAIRLLLLTGARKTEVLALRWTEIDWERNQLVLSPSRTKTGGRAGVRRIPLSAAAVNVLKARPRVTEYVFPAGRKQLGYAKGLQKAWCELRERAGLHGMRVHDLRHSFASLALAGDANIVLISRVLGHTTTRMTERYLHTHDGDLRRVVEQVGSGLV